MSIKLENVVLASPEQMEFIIEGMRNPMNSWEKSDSYENFDVNYDKETLTGIHRPYYRVGASDNSLMQRLANAGTDHRKYMRMMPIYVRITAPLYWWKEFDTYKVGTTANSCSTMHKIHAREFTVEDFSVEHLLAENAIYFGKTIERLNNARNKFLETKDKEYWWQMIQLLPSSYNQTRNVMLNYEVAANIYKSRKNHKLDEWIEFCKWLETLPHSKVITGIKE